MSTSPVLPRLLLVVLVLFAATALAATVVAGTSGPGDRSPAASVAPAPAPSPTAEPVDGGARGVLRAWDGRRARAWASGDVAALRTLYAPGSLAGAHDVAMLRRWRDRGLRVDGLQTQVLALRVLRRHPREEPRRFVLRVTDRLATAVAVGPQGRMALPRDRASSWRIELVRPRGADWQVTSLEAVRE